VKEREMERCEEENYSKDVEENTVDKSESNDAHQKVATIYLCISVYPLLTLSPIIHTLKYCKIVIGIRMEEVFSTCWTRISCVIGLH
jgi:hypothetical protein